MIETFALQRLDLISKFDKKAPDLQPFLDCDQSPGLLRHHQLADVAMPSMAGRCGLAAPRHYAVSYCF